MIHRIASVVHLPLSNGNMEDMADYTDNPQISEPALSLSCMKPLTAITTPPSHPTLTSPTIGHVLHPNNKVRNPAILFLSHIKTGEKFVGCPFSFFPSSFQIASRLLINADGVPRTTGGGKGEKSLDAKSVQCSILLGGHTNARYVL